MAETENSQEKNSPRPSVFASRRHFIQLGVAAVGAAWAGALVQAGLFPQETVEEAEPVEIPMSELPVGAARPLTYGGTPVILIRSAESIKAFSLICTHLGCLVEWQADKKEFFCPCHDGRFDQFGEVVAGPPPVPLEEFPVTVEEDRVIVGELV